MNANVFRSAVRRAGVVCVSVVAVCVLQSGSLAAQSSPELSSLDMWIVQRYRGAQLLPDSGARTPTTLAQAGAPRIESTRGGTRRDAVVALHFGETMWRPSIAPAAPVQLADPSGTVSGIAGIVTARRAFRTPRVAGARDTVRNDWRIGWAYLVAIPVHAANASPSGFSGWALAEMPTKSTAKSVKAPPGNSQKERSGNSTTVAPVAPSTTAQSTPPSTLPPIR